MGPKLVRTMRPSELATVAATRVTGAEATVARLEPSVAPSVDESSSERSDVGFAALMGAHPLATDAPVAPSAPHRVGRFVIVDRIGAGAMGVVFAAYDPKLDRKVAIKLVDLGVVSTEPGESRCRLEREAQAAATLSHPNVVTVYDVGSHDGGVFLAMEFVEGTTLSDWLAQEPRSWRAVAEMFAAAGRGLAAAHAAGLVHRDFKPDNVLVGRDGRPRVADFGLARPVDGWSTRDAERVRLSGRTISRSVTEPDAEICGTPAYMAPEQYIGANIGPCSDQFGFCAALYEGLYGVRPFQGDSISELAAAILDGRVARPPGSRRVPRALSRLVLRGLEPEPGRRHASMDALVRGLERLVGARRRRVWIAGATLASVGALGVGYRVAAAQQIEPCDGVTAAMDEAWTDERRGRIDAAIGAAGWSDRAPSIDGALDEYASEWRTRRIAACEATRVRNEASDRALDLRFACLDRAAASFDAVGAELEQGATAQRDPSDSLALLAELPACDDLDALAVLEDGLGARGDAARWRELAEIDGELTRVQARHLLGKAGWASDAADLLAHAQTLALPRHAAHAQLLLGVAALRDGRLDDANAQLQAAVEGALASGDDPLAVDAMLHRGDLEVQRGRADRAQLHLEYAEATLASLREVQRVRLRPVFDRLAGSLAWQAGRYDDAVSRLGAAIAHLEARPWPRDPLAARQLATLYGELGVAYKEVGRPDEAMQSLRRALEIYEGIEGIEPELLAQTHENLAINATQLRRFDVAEEHFDAAARIFAAQGERVPPIALALLESNRGWLDRERGKLDEARRRQEQALASCLAAVGDAHPACAYPRIELASIARLQRAYPEAMEQLGQAGRLRVTTLGEDHPETAFTLTLLAWVLLDQGQLDAAEGPIRDAQRIFAAHPEASPVDRATADYVQARLVSARDPDEGAVQLEAVEDELERLGPRAESIRLDLASWRIAAAQQGVPQPEETPPG